STFFINTSLPSAYYLISLHDALPISENRRSYSNFLAHGWSALLVALVGRFILVVVIVRRDIRICNAFAHCRQTGLPNNLFQSCRDRKSTRLNSSHVKISYAVFCLKKK